MKLENKQLKPPKTSGYYTPRRALQQECELAENVHFVPGSISPETKVLTGTNVNTLFLTVTPNSLHHGVGSTSKHSAPSQ